MKEIFLIDKPKGITSFDVIRRLRRELGGKKIGHGLRLKLGHAGTLDPLATGLMIIGAGEGTKKLAEYLKLPKTYEAEILLGEKRTTGDVDGEIIEALTELLDIEDRVIKKALTGMIGTLLLPVPVYSAIKRDGEPLYKKARRGERVEVPSKEMEVRSAVVDKITRNKNRIHVYAVFDVGSGTYIRSLAEELGARLGVPATLANLRRTRIGEFDIADAQQL